MSNLSNSTDSKKIGSRLAMLRNECGLKQTDICNMVSEALDRKKPYTEGAISSWELGNRIPSIRVFNVLAKIYNCTTEYLLCLTDDRHSDKSEMNPRQSALDALQSRNVAEIPVKDIALFDGKPVFIEYKNLAHNPHWGIVDVKENAILTTNGYIAFDNDQINKIYVDEPSYIHFSSATGKFPLDMGNMLSKQNVYIEMITPDQTIASHYNGWFHHNENRTCLINNIGLTLPYEGLNCSYRAYNTF